MARTFIEWTPASGEGWYASGSHMVHWSWERHLLIAGFGGAEASGHHGERLSPDSGDLRCDVRQRTSTRSRPSASISASTPYSADRSSSPVSTVSAPSRRDTKVAVDPDRKPDGRWVHDAMVKGWQVTPPHRDQVTAGLKRAAGRQQPQFP